MRYTSFKICGFPRAGSNYVCYLIGSNFFGHTRLKNDLVTHALSWHTAPKGSALIYLRREFEGVARSLWKFRGRFGFGDCSFEEFIETRLCDLPRVTNTPASTINWIGSKTHGRESNNLLVYRKCRLVECWEEHVRFGVESSKNNVLLLDYERMLSNFHEEMLRVAKYLGSDKTSFEDTKERVGFYLQSDEGAWFRE